ncbi:MAG: hypothetical protein JNL60_07255 [Bacteroidia bacterium]|nr:hypothetical protein [Bacteroidia bacterium]
MPPAQICIFINIISGMYLIGLIIYLVICYLVADKIGRHKKIGFTKTLIACILVSPFVGYLIAEGSATAEPRGCKWCGNSENEAYFCGVCGKNEEGDIGPHFKDVQK